MSARSSRFFSIGGTLDPGSESYLERPADALLFQALLGGEYVFILDSRQKGKSSLVARAVARLKEASVRVVKVDLQRIGSRVTQEQWYAGLLHSVSSELGCADASMSAWAGGEGFGALKRWVDALDVVVLGLESPLVIVFDEIDFVRSLPFSVDEFFGAIRSFYNKRADHPAYRQLTVGLVGVALPAQLVRNPEITPFNIGRRIELSDFDRSDLQAYEPVLDRAGLDGKAILDRIHHWVRGHPYLTQLLCDASVRGGMGGPHAVDAFVAESFLRSKSSCMDPHLAELERRLLEPFVPGVPPDEAKASLLDVYERMLRRGYVPLKETEPAHENLRLAGVATARGGELVARNLLYTKVFDCAWARAHRPEAEVRRQRHAVRKTTIKVGSASLVLLAVFGVLLLNAVLAGRSREQAVGRLQTLATATSRQAYNLSLLRADRDADAGSWSSVRETLERTRTSPFRGWEWSYFDSLVWSNVREVRVGDSRASGHATFDPDGDPVYLSTGGVYRWDGSEIPVPQERRWKGTALQYLLFVPTEFVRQKGLTVPEAWLRLRRVGDWESLAPSPSGESAVVKGRDGKIVVVGRLGTRELTRLDSMPPAAFSADESVLVWSDRIFGMDPGHLTATEVSTGRTIWRRPIQPPTALVASPDGEAVAVCGTGSPTELYRVNDGAPLEHLPTRYVAARSLAFSRDSRRLAVGFVDGTVWVYHRGKGSVESVLRGLPTGLSSVAFAEDGKSILAATSDGTMRAYAVDKAPNPRAVSIGGGEIQRCAFSPDGSRLVLSGHDGTVTLFEFPSLSQIAKIATGSPANCSEVSFSPDSGRLAVSRSTGAVELLDARSGSRLATLDGHLREVEGLEWSPDGLYLASGSPGGGLLVWKSSPVNAPVLAVEAASPAGRGVLALCWSTDGKRLACSDNGGGIELWRATKAGLVRERRTELAQGEKDAEVRADRSPIRSLVFAKDGSALFGASRRRVCRFAVPSLAREFESWGHADRIHSVTLAPSGTLVMTHSMDSTARAWDARSGKGVFRLPHDGWVASARFSPDGTRIVTASGDGRARVWDAKEGDLLAVLREASSTVFDAQWSPDGRYLATVTTEGIARIYDSRAPSIEERTGKKGVVQR